MTPPEIIVLLLALLLALGWARAIRLSAKRRLGVTLQTCTTAMLWALGVVGVLPFRYSPLHFLWFFPAALLLGSLSLLFPLSLVWTPARSYAKLCCLGLEGPEEQP